MSDFTPQTLNPWEAKYYGWIEDGFVPPDDLKKYYKPIRRFRGQYYAYICPNCMTCFPPHLRGSEAGFRAHMVPPESRKGDVVTLLTGCWMKPGPPATAPTKSGRLGGPQ